MLSWSLATGPEPRVLVQGLSAGTLACVGWSAGWQSLAGVTLLLDLGALSWEQG